MTGVLTGRMRLCRRRRLFCRKDDHDHRCGQRHRPRHRVTFCTRGANVVCADIMRKALTKRLRRSTGKAAGRAHQGHVTERTDVDDMADARRSFGRVQFLFNSAGAASAAPNSEDR